MNVMKSDKPVTLSSSSFREVYETLEHGQKQEVLKRLEKYDLKRTTFYRYLKNGIPKIWEDKFQSALNVSLIERNQLFLFSK
jgi:ACT domain-containing protein